MTTSNLVLVKKPDGSSGNNQSITLVTLYMMFQQVGVDESELLAMPVVSDDEEQGNSDSDDNTTTDGSVIGH